MEKNNVVMRTLAKVEDEEQKRTILSVTLESEESIKNFWIGLSLNSGSEFSEILDELSRVYFMNCPSCGPKKLTNDILEISGAEPIFCECEQVCMPEQLYKKGLPAFTFIIASMIRKDEIKPSRGTSEKKIENHFASLLSGAYKQQVKTVCGIIDILTDDYIYEVKCNPTLSDLHKAYGQLKHYQHEYPDRKLAIVANKFPEGYFNKEVDLVICEVPE